MSVHVCVCASVQNKVSIKWLSLSFRSEAILQSFGGQSTIPWPWGALPTSIYYHYVRK